MSGSTSLRAVRWGASDYITKANGLHRPLDAAVRAGKGVESV